MILLTIVIKVDVKHYNIFIDVFNTNLHINKYISIDLYVGNDKF